MKTHQKSELVAPVASRTRRIWYSRLTPTWLSGLILFSCLFLPLTQGCNNTDIYPYQLYGYYDSPGTIVTMQWVNAPYVLGLAAAVATLLIAITGRAIIFRWLWTVYAIVGCLLSLIIWLCIAHEAQSAGDFQLLEFVRQSPYMTWPTLVVPAIFILTYFNCRTWPAAALWAQCALATICATWFGYFWYHELASGETRIGVKVALVASSALAVSSLVACRSRLGLCPSPTRPGAANPARAVYTGKLSSNGETER